MTEIGTRPRSAPNFSPERMLGFATLLVLVIAAAAMAALVLYVISRVALGTAVLSRAIGIVYVVLPLGATAVLIALAKASADVRAAGVLSLACLLVALFIVEVGVETVEWQFRLRVMRAARAAGRAFDGRLPIDVVDSLRRAGVHAFPAMYGPFISSGSFNGTSLRLRIGRDTILPLAGPPSQVTVSCNESGRYDIYRSDAGGFNNDDAIWGDSAPALVVIGDSFVAGACVPRDSGLVGALVRSGARAVNLGVGGSGPLLELARLREFAAARKPGVVLWVYTEENDFEDLERELLNPTLRQYVVPGFTQQLASYGDRLGVALEQRLDSAIATYIAKRSRWARIRALSVRDIVLLQSLREKLGVPSLATGRLREIRCCDVTRYDYRTFTLLLAEARDEVAAWGGRLIFAAIPENAHFSTPSGRFCQRCTQSPYVDSLTAARHRLIEIARGLGIPIVDLHQPFLAQTHRESLYQFAGSHFSPRGYQLAADVVLRELDHLRHP